MGPLQSDFGWRQDQVKMIGHHHKFMQQIFLLHSVIQQDFNEEARNLLNLKKASFFEDIGGYKVSGFSGYTSTRNRPSASQRLKPTDYSSLTAGLEGLLHPMKG